nr:hypothetical protein [uncultured Roseococcus sp.]
MTDAARLERALTENEQLQTSLHAAHCVLREVANLFHLYALDPLARAQMDERNGAMASRIEMVLGGDVAAPPRKKARAA